MKHFTPTIAGLSIVLTLSSFFIDPMIIDLHKQVKKKNIECNHRQLTLLDEPGYSGIRLSKDYGEGIAWLKGVEFSNGIIEFDVRGENTRQHSFVGIAFHAENDTTYDAIYLRPFQFQEKDEMLRNRQIQYISLPKFTWQVLRAKFPGQFEHAINPSPDPNAWVRMKVVVQDNTISTYVNNSKEPNMIVQKVTAFHGGAIGFYVADTSGGDFANLTITKTK